MTRTRLSRFFITATAFTALVALPGCTDWFKEPPPKPKHTISKPKKKEKIAASAYVENLSLARMELAAKPADITGLSPRLAVMRDYMAQSKAKGEMVWLVMLTYSQEGKDGQQQVVAPVSLKQRQFPALDKVMTRLDAQPHRLQDIKVIVTQVAPDAEFSLTEEPLALASELEAGQRKLLSQYGELKPAERIMAQIALVEYFTDHRYRDAAYMTLDSTRKLLAQAAQEKTLDEESLTTLSRKLDQMESRLKKKLPYTF